MSITVTETKTNVNGQANENGAASLRLTAPVKTVPLKLSGALDGYAHKEITPVIGTEFPDANVADMLHAPNADELLRDLAVMVSQRGFCIFRHQSNLSIADEKLLCHRLGQLTTRPYTSSLYIHPVNQMELADGSIDPEVMSPSRNTKNKLYIREGGYSKGSERNQSRADGWHTDGSFEHVPPDYTLLHMVKVPVEGSGGDTMFASAYEAYDLLSPPMKKFLESLNATFMPWDHKPENIINHMWKGTRGAPENQGPELRASHPCVRTNPVTGWKSLFAFGHHLEEFEGLGDVENRIMKEFVQRLITENHQLQARVRWEQDDLVIWDNRAVYHSATYDYGGIKGGKRIGNRVCGVGEIPYLDPRSSGRRYALGMDYLA
ncbi:uncharacterized protein BHQ10_004207 [Talaromyces amestolkiae]|uniref:TauD/TfdA-like domain-containing protein n=1 Tax=Talaromyces amestolkiae TaxID=1196081 RepID=A0A364KXB5_TALAM|nr:uncharacterized protein BHQ10_004207 [Talaromyces amestolkiae]RAO68195.1 hypothetical protein BHQ10_004207 [Talaromyces amestolkiae]